MSKENISEKTPREKFRNSVGFQFNFVQFSGLSIEDAIDNICKRLDRYVEQYKIALADAVRAPMGVVPDSAAGLLTDKDLREAEARRTNKPVLEDPCAECKKPVGNDYVRIEGDPGFVVCGECNCAIEESWDELQAARRNNEI